jgi:hypothetical protein
MVLELAHPLPLPVLAAAVAMQNPLLVLLFGCYPQVLDLQRHLLLQGTQRVWGAAQTMQDLSNSKEVQTDARTQPRWSQVAFPCPSIQPACKLLKAGIVGSATEAYHGVDSFVFTPPALLSSILPLGMPSVFGDVFEAAHGGRRCRRSFIVDTRLERRTQSQPMTPAKPREKAYSATSHAPLTFDVELRNYEQTTIVNRTLSLSLSLLFRYTVGFAYRDTLVSRRWQTTNSTSMSLSHGTWPFGAAKPIQQQTSRDAHHLLEFFASNCKSALIYSRFH